MTDKVIFVGSGLLDGIRLSGFHEYWKGELMEEKKPDEGQIDLGPSGGEAFIANLQIKPQTDNRYRDHAAERASNVSRARHKAERQRVRAGRKQRH